MNMEISPWEFGTSIGWMKTFYNMEQEKQKKIEDSFSEKFGKTVGEEMYKAMRETIDFRRQTLVDCLKMIRGESIEYQEIKPSELSKNLSEWVSKEPFSICGNRRIYFFQNEIRKIDEEKRIRDRKDINFWGLKKGEPIFGLDFILRGKDK